MFNITIDDTHAIQSAACFVCLHLTALTFFFSFWVGMEEKGKKKFFPPLFSLGWERMSLSGKECATIFAYHCDGLVCLHFVSVAMRLVCCSDAMSCFSSSELSLD